MAEMKFCIISANRCGSTWLQFMLNALPKIASDYEMNWTAGRLSTHHRSLKDESLLDILAPLMGKGINAVGSKLVLAPPHDVRSQDSKAMRKRLVEADLIIRLHRPLFDSFYSKYIGGGHLRNEKNSVVPECTGAWLNDKEYFSERNAMPVHALDLDYLECDLKKRLEIESIINSVSDAAKCISVAYSDITNRFYEIALALDPSVNQGDVNAQLESPPTVRIPKLEPQQLFTNWVIVNEMAGYYESIREVVYS
jgi:hypothetical protein